MSEFDGWRRQRVGCRESAGRVLCWRCVGADGSCCTIMSCHDAGGRRRYEDSEFTLRVYPGALSEGTIYCPITARKGHVGGRGHRARHREAASWTARASMCSPRSRSSAARNGS
ncbi:hypothetical protein Q8A67_025795 [Cirrhinus molitorella]|uniref:Uncharacterized protein n=1 Tax=Cirrhinus molitorella TaxID=172907 RepID=A0AA88P920_9TELE|nr:hypothetical protein Q8A67_025795 [Cirrhinus molitorella]